MYSTITRNISMQVQRCNDCPFHEWTEQHEWFGHKCTAINEQTGYSSGGDGFEMTMLNWIENECPFPFVKD